MARNPTSHGKILKLTADGLTPRQIAIALGMSVQNVYAHLRRAGVKPAQT